MYQKTENEAFLQHAIDQVEDALGKGKQNVGGSPSALEYHAIIRNLVEERKKVANRCGDARPARKRTPPPVYFSSLVAIVLVTAFFFL
ncbi:hypothetical protein AUP68_03197 [Ilyonectria robusta]